MSLTLHGWHNPAATALACWLLASLGMIGCDDNDTGRTQPERVVRVTSLTLEARTLPETVPGVGSLRAIEISTMAPEVGGNIIGRYFEDGHRVKKDDILYTLDRRTQQATLESTQARLAEAQWIWSRMQILAQTQAASDAEVAETAFAIESLMAQVAKQQAAVDKLTIRAPYDGRVAIHMIDVGSYANVGDQLVDVVNDSVMLIDYELPARWLSKLQVGQDIELSTEADPDRIYKGRVTAINPLVSSNTRSIQVRGQIPNPDFSLMSGLFANTVQTIGSFKNVLVVPQAALVYGTNGAQIFAVQDSKAVPIAVEVGQKIGTQAIITAARPAAASDSKSSTPTIELKPGLEIIVTGAAKIRPGTTVRTSPYLPADVSVTTGLPKTKSGS